MNRIKRIFAFLLAVVWALALTACGDLDLGSLLDALDDQPQPSAAAAAEHTAPPDAQPPAETETPETTPAVSEDGWYNSKEEAQAKGWTGGSVERYTGEGTAIGGDYFGNREGYLPKAQGRTYTECDIDTVGGADRGAKRLVFSNDGLIYYTEDHYNTFELLYGEP